MRFRTESESGGRGGTTMLVQAMQVTPKVELVSRLVGTTIIPGDKRHRGIRDTH
jgi:hypothetical protein